MEERLEKIIEAVMKVGRGDYSVQIKLSGENDELDSLAMGINMMINDIREDVIERRGMGEKLRGSEERLKILFENAPDAYYLHDLKGNLVDGNKAAEKLTGYKRTELIGKNLLKLNLLSPAQLPKAAALFAQQALGKGTGPDEFTIKRKNGTIVVAEIITYPVKIQNKTLVLAIARDISERKKMDESLKNSEERFRILFEDAPDAYSLAEFNGKLVAGNKALEELTGYSNDEMNGQNLLKFKMIPLDIVPKLATLLARGAAGGRIRGEELALIRKNGERRAVELNVQPLKMKDKTLLLAILRDITERKRIQEKLAESEERYRDLFENANDLIQSVDRDGRYVYVNRKWLEVLEYSKDEIKKLTMQDVIRKDELPHCLGVFKEITEGKPITQVETVFVSKSGKEVYVEGNINAQFKGDEFVASRGLFRDVTVRRRLEEEKRKIGELKERDRLKTEFLSVISHELRTPVTPVKGYLSLLLNGTAGQLEDKQKEFLQKIDRQYNHLMNIIDSILDFARIETGRQVEVKKEPVFLAKEIEEVIKSTGEEFSSKKITVKSDFAADLPTILGDESKINRAVTNIMGNAVKFVPRGGEVVITAKEEDGQVRVEIKDNGIGIARENLERVFDKFYQVDSSYTRAAGGIGMGLAIAREIIQAHGGKLWAESDGLGKGSRFILTLPLT